MAGTLYNVVMSNATVIASGEILTIRAATALASRGSVLCIRRISVSQAGTATSQQLAVKWGLKASAFSTMTSTTPAAVYLGTVASAIAGGTSGAAATCGTNSSANGGGAFTTLDARGFNNLAGAEIIFTDREAPVVSIDQTFTVALVGTPTTLASWYGTLTFEEWS